MKRTPRQTTAGIGIDATSDDEDIPSHDLDAQDTDSDKEIENDDEMDQLISMVHIANEQSDEEDDAIHQTISSMHHIGDQYNATENIDFDDLNFA